MTQSNQSSQSNLTLEVATVIRVPPPGMEGGYTVAVVRTPNGLRTGRLLCPPDAIPPAGTRLELTDSPVEGAPAYRPTAV